jgi:hypothetical protein
LNARDDAPYDDGPASAAARNPPRLPLTMAIRHERPAFVSAAMPRAREMLGGG